MWKHRTKFNQSLLLLPSLSNRTSFYSSQILSHHINPSKPLPNFPIKPPNLRNPDSDDDLILPTVKRHEIDTDVGLIMDIIGPPGRDFASARSNLAKCDVAASPQLVTDVLSQVRNNWKAAFTFFRWVGKQPNYAHSYRDYHCVISILGKMRRFNAAWAVISEMNKGGRNGGMSMVTPQTLLLMIRRYSAVHDVDNAVKTFYAYKRFNFRVGDHEFHDLLSALCRYKNVKEAEVLLKRNEDAYALTTKSYNIILNGWCNVICSPREGRRVWWEMCNKGIPRDVVSYSTIIACYSKCNEVREVIKIFNELKVSHVKPDVRIYNGVIHAFCKSGLESEARELMKSMKEKGIHPNVVTYNSLIMPLCKKGKSSDAFNVFDEMLQRGLMPSVQTYHAFFRASRASKEALLILQRMNQMGCCPNHDTYTMLIRKFCRWGDFENVWRLWDEMVRNGLDPDRSAYVALVNGLFLNRKLEEGYKYYVEMKSKGLLPEPEMEETMQAWMASRQATKQSMIETETKCSDG